MSLAGVLVFADLSSGSLDDAGKGILAEGRRLAETLGAPWAAACFAGAPDGAYEAMRPYGVPEVLDIRGPEELADLPCAQAEALADAARACGARVVLLAHDDPGATLAPRIAARLGAALFTEAVSFSRDWDGLTVRRRAVGVQVVEQRLWNEAAPGGGSPYGRRDEPTPLVLTMLPRVLSAAVVPGMRPGPARRTARLAAVSEAGAATRVRARIPPDPRTVDVAEAQVIFAAGLGCDRESFAQLCELADRVGASVGVSRPVYDLGWKELPRMIGQTGKTVGPRLYFAWGISGSMHHLGGIGGSRRIVCLNADPKAPIFPAADEGFVADLREVLPRLLAAVGARAQRDGEREVAG
ncbi:MAG: electron transfer flavoprotein subunit alpha/FixB family protein [Deltaproteobacteria bacterium]|nr:electron transfer flavoprotein subunit alpha/FixB family protein [Deltaproteobacteria bacterium]